MANTVRIALIACSSSKLPGKHPAGDIYVSTLFRLSRAWAQRYCDGWFILSAKHHLLHPHECIKSYDLALKDLSRQERECWARITASKIKQLPTSDFILLGGDHYASALQDIVHIRPMKGLFIGQQLQWLQSQLKAPSASHESDHFALSQVAHARALSLSPPVSLDESYR